MRLTTLHRPTFAMIVVIALLAFALRLWNNSVTNYDLDESWTYSQVLFARHPDTFYQIYREPNNTLHILTGIPLANLIPEKIGFRFWSIAASMLAVAAVGRLAFRLFGRHAVLIAALLAALSFSTIDYGQHVRPYALANLCGVLALLMWIEQKHRLNILFSSLTPLFHIAAFPIVMVQDVLTLWRVLRRQNVNILEWILQRIPPYIMVLFVVYIVHVREVAQGRQIGGGQIRLTIGAFINGVMWQIIGTETALATLLIGITLGLIVISGIVYGVRKRIPATIAIPIWWLVLTYSALFALTIFSTGQIKHVHITHVTLGFALLSAGILVQIPRLIRWGIVSLWVLASIASLVPYYQTPFQSFTEAYSALHDWQQNNDKTIYIEKLFPRQGLILNAPPDASFDWLEFVPAFELLPDEPYYFLAFRNFTPLMPEECQDTVVLQTYDFHLHYCIPAQEGT